MSLTRWIIRGLLVLILIGVAYAAYRARVPRSPDYYLARAAAAEKAGQPKSAKIYLQRLVQQHPKDARGQRALSEALLKEAELPVEAASYARQPAALNLLVEAGRLAPDELELQKAVLTACLSAGRVPQAATAATRVIKAEPKNSEAIFALAWRAAEAGDEEETLDQLAKLPEEQRKSFRALGLAAQVLADRNARDERLPAALDAIAARAGELTTDELKRLSEHDFVMMNRLLPAGVAAAEDPATAFRRAGGALAVCEKLAEEKSPRLPAAQTMAATISAVLTAKFPLLAADSDLAAQRKALTERLEKVIGPQATGEKPTAIVAHEAAQMAFAKGDYSGAAAIAEKSLEQQKDVKTRTAKTEEIQALHFLAARAYLAERRHAEAKKHLAALVEDKRTSGLGQLMLGAVAGSDGRHQDALKHFTVAEHELGMNPLVQLSLAQTLLALGQWQEALPRLSALHELVKTEDPEVKAWLAQQQLTDARIHLQEARAQLALGRWLDAQPHIAALASTELKPRSLDLQAEYLISKKQYDQAEKLLAQALAEFPSDDGLIARRAALLTATGRAGEAESFLATKAQAKPDDLSLQLMLVREHSRAGRHDQALAMVTELEKKHPQSVPLLLLKADVLTAANKPQEAAAVVEQVRQLPSGGTLASVLDAVFALRTNDPKRAAEAVEASGKVADNLLLRHLAGEAAVVQGDFRGAITALSESVRATALRSRAGPLLWDSVVKLSQKEGAAAAEKALAPVVAANPDEPFVIIADADVRAMQGRFNEALQRLDHLEQVDKDSPIGAHLKGVILSRTGDAAGAMSELRRALAKQPQYVPSLALLAQLQLASRDFNGAIASAQQAWSLSPAAWQLGVLKSEAELAAGKKEAAIATARGLAEKAPEVVDVQRHLVSLLARAGQREEALAVCQQVRAKFPDDAAAKIQEVVLLGLTGKAEESQRAGQAFVGEPVNSDNAYSIAIGFMQFQDFAQARHYAQLALTTANAQQQAPLHQFLGNLALTENGLKPDRKLLEEAREHFAAVLKLVPADFVAGNNLAWLLAVDFNQPAEAVQVAERARGNAPTSRLPVTFVDTLATVYRKAGEFKKAAQLLEEALDANPKANILRFHLGMTLGQLERTVEAKQLLNEALAAGLSPEQSQEAKRELERIAAAEAAAQAAAADAAAATKNNE